VTDTVTMNPEDRALWDRYVRLRRGAPKGAGEVGTIGGDDVAMLAAYVELRLDEWERAAFERRLVDEPILLETLIATRAAMAASTAPTAVPQAVTAYALNMAPPPATVRTPSRPAESRPRADAPRRRWLLTAPALAWSLVTVAFLAAFVAGAFVTWQVTEMPMTADKAKEKDPLSSELRQSTNSIFDPAPTIIDGMDVEE
jgi:hypothetical protein